MAARSAWSGAITFAGFPIHVQAYNVLSSKKPLSLKLLSPTNEPVEQVYVSASGWKGKVGDCGKGVEVAKGQITPLASEVVEALGNAERSVTLDVERFAPRDSVPLGYATAHFRITPNAKVPGSEGPVNILWNGLRSSGRVLVTEWTTRAGARPSLLAIEADDDGLLGHSLPYKSDFASIPSYAPTQDAQAAQMFEQVVSANYNTDPFDHDAYEDTYTKQRGELIAKALNGEVIDVVAAAPQAAPVPDLMAAMKASLAAAGNHAPAKDVTPVAA